MTVPPDDIISAARASLKKWGIPASVSIAQWALESGWGKHMPPGSNNPFGIKARIRGGKVIDPYVSAQTSEETANGVWHGAQPFRKFASLNDAFDYHGQMLAILAPYAKARAKLPDADAFADALTGVYATDHQYGTLLKSIMRGSNLYQYDEAPAC